MSGNLNQSVRRTITNTPPIVSLMKSSPKARIPANKKKKYTLAHPFFGHNFCD